MSTKTLMTADQLWQMPNNGFRYGLVERESLHIAPAGSNANHSRE